MNHRKKNQSNTRKTKIMVFKLFKWSSVPSSQNHFFQFFIILFRIYPGFKNKKEISIIISLINSKNTRYLSIALTQLYLFVRSISQYFDEIIYTNCLLQYKLLCY